MAKICEFCLKIFILVIVVQADEHSEIKLKMMQNKNHKCLTQLTAPKKVENIIEKCKKDVKIALLKIETYEINQDHQYYDTIAEYNYETATPNIFEEILSYGSDSEIKNINDQHFYNPNIKHGNHFNYHSYVPIQYINDDKTRYELSNLHFEDQGHNYPDIIKTYDVNRRLKRDLDNLNIHQFKQVYPDEKWIAGCLLHCVYEEYGVVDELGWPTLDGLVDFYSDGIEEQRYFLAILRASDGCLKKVSNKHNVKRNFAPIHGQQCDLSFELFDCITDKIIDYCNLDETTNTHNISNHYHNSGSSSASIHIYH